MKDSCRKREIFTTDEVTLLSGFVIFVIKFKYAKKNRNNQRRWRR